MTSYRTPGVYSEGADAHVPALTALRTDIAGFVGMAERGPLHDAVPVQSWRQFQAAFGTFTGSGYLAYAVKGFFENGGRKCYVVRVADRASAASAAVTLPDVQGNPAWLVEALNPGIWGNQLAIQVRATHRAQTRTVPGPFGQDRTGSQVESTAHLEPGTLVRIFQAGSPVFEKLHVVAAVDGNRQRVTWTEPLENTFATDMPAFVESVEYTLTVLWQGRVVAIYERLSVVPTHPRFAEFILDGELPPPENGRRGGSAQPMPLVVVRSAPWPAAPEKLLADAIVPLSLSGGADGLAQLSVEDFIGEAEDLLGNDEDRAIRRRGLRALEPVGEISIIAAPDIHIRPFLPPEIAPLPPPPRDLCLEPLPANPGSAPGFPELPPVFTDEQIFRVQSALVAQCEELRDRFALLDPPFSAAGDASRGEAAIVAWRSRFESKYAALYYPWLRVLDPLRLRGELVRALPPSGHVAGLMASTDLKVGVHKAPANAVLNWSEDTTAAVGTAAQAGLNPLGINAIRVFPGRGILLYGSRTVSSDPDWRYVNVRRLLLMIEEALDVSTQWVVFEPNDACTRGKVLLTITTFLEALWRQGALAGSQPDQAFYVKCDEGNNPPAEREEGRLHIDVGVAPSVPYEFIVLRIGRTAAELEVTEQV